jgi:hypothetical protein
MAILRLGKTDVREARASVWNLIIRVVRRLGSFACLGWRFSDPNALTCDAVGSIGKSIVAARLSR